MARPKPLADVLSELMARRGYSRVRGRQAYGEAWQRAVGEVMARFSRVGELRRGTLDVLVSHSAMLQELTFKKTSILAQLNELLPDAKIRDLRCRVGPVE